MQLPKLRRRFDPQLVDEQRTCGPVSPKRLRLSPGPIQRQHQLPAQPLAVGVLSHQLLELTDQQLGAPELELGRDPLLKGDDPQLL